MSNVEEIANQKAAAKKNHGRYLSGALSVKSRKSVGSGGYTQFVDLTDLSFLSLTILGKEL
jgi:hypothetical protein